MDAGEFYEASVSRGFDYFDGNQKENFAAALILLCIEEDPAFRSVVSTLIRDRVGLPANQSLSAWGREATLDPGSDASDEEGRSDLWLCFPVGTILVEIKTHSRWDPLHVAQQIAKQRTSRVRNERVHEAVLLAPGQLLRRLPPSNFPRIRWQDFLKLVSDIESPSRVLQLANEHWSRSVEQDFGLPVGTPVVPFDTLAAQSSCLAAFLRAAILHLGGKTRGEKVWFTLPDGSPDRKGQWAWHGIAVPGTLPTVGKVYVGIFTYSTAPPGQPLGTYLEVYTEANDDNPLAFIAFTPPDLSAPSLNAILDEFAKEYAASEQAG